MKINPLGNRLAVSSIDYALSIYNIHKESGLTHYRDIQSAASEILDVGKIAFNPIGNEILTGIMSLKTIDITTGEVTKEFNKGTKAIMSIAYVRNRWLKDSLSRPMGCSVQAALQKAPFRSSMREITSAKRSSEVSHSNAIYS